MDESSLQLPRTTRAHARNPPYLNLLMDTDTIKTLIERGLPDGAREWLGMMGFRIVVNYRGELVKLDQPGTIEEE